MSSNKNQLSLVALYDDFGRKISLLMNSNEVDIPYLIKKTEENRIKWLQAETELREAKKKITQLVEQNHELSNKLTNLRKLYGKEVHKSQLQQKDSERYRAILDLVRKTVNDDIRGSKESLLTSSIEGFELLSILDHPEQYLQIASRKSQILNVSKSFEEIDEEEFAFDKTDDSIDESYTDNKARNRRSSVRPNETVIHQTEVKKLRTQSPINNEKNSSNRSTSDHIEHDIRTDSEENYCQNLSMAPSNCATPNFYSSRSTLRRNGSRKVVLTDMNRLDSRPHKLVNKKMYKSSNCNVCEKRIGFCGTARCCEDCRSIAHIQCAKDLALPCIQHFSPRAKERQVIGDFTAQNVRPFVPAIIIYCCKEIETRGLREEGLYRKCGSDREIREVKDKILKSKTGRPCLSAVDIHTLCGVVKSFLKNLSEPVVAPILWPDFIKTGELCSSSESVSEKERLFLRIINRLPDANRDTLAYLMLHLKRIAEESKYNKMEECSLSRIFAPTIVGWSSSGISAAHIEENSKQIQCMKALINMSKDFWNNILEKPRTIDSLNSPYKFF